MENTLHLLESSEDLINYIKNHSFEFSGIVNLWDSLYMNVLYSILSDFINVHSSFENSHDYNIYRILIASLSRSEFTTKMNMLVYFNMIKQSELDHYLMLNPNINLKFIRNYNPKYDFKLEYLPRNSNYDWIRIPKILYKKYMDRPTQSTIVESFSVNKYTTMDDITNIKNEFKKKLKKYLFKKYIVDDALKDHINDYMDMLDHNLYEAISYDYYGTHTEYILQNPTLNWDWFYVSLTIDFKHVINYPNFNWHYNALSANKTITEDIIYDNTQIPWDWNIISIIHHNNCNKIRHLCNQEILETMSNLQKTMDIKKALKMLTNLLCQYFNNQYVILNIMLYSDNFISKLYDNLINVCKRNYYQHCFIYTPFYKEFIEKTWHPNNLKRLQDNGFDFMDDLIQ